MVDPALQNYVSEARKIGFDDARIREELTKNGWAAEAVEEALKPAVQIPETPLPKTPSVPVTDPKPNVQSSVQPASVIRVEPRKNNLLKYLIAGGAVIFVLVGAGAAFAFRQQLMALLPGQNKAAEADLFSGLADKLTSIHSSVYAISMKVETQPREASTTPLTTSFPEFEKARLPYTRDNERFSDIQTIQSMLRNSFYTHHVYLSQLSQLRNAVTEQGNLTYSGNVTTTDPLTGQAFGYKTTKNGQDYELTFTLETDEAVKSMKQNSYGYGTTTLVVNGKTITMGSRDYVGYVSMPPEPWFVTYFGSDSGMMMSFLPTDMSVTLSASGTTESKNVGDVATDAKLNLGADVRFGDFSASVAAAFLKKAETYYLDVVKFPSLFMDLTPIKNKWVQFTLDDIGTGYSFVDPETIEDLPKKQQDYLSQAKLLYVAAQQGGVIQVTKIVPDPKDEQHKGLVGYSVRVVREKVADYYKNMADQLEQKYPDDTLFKFDQTTYDYLKGDGFTQLFTYLGNNTSFDIWLDLATGYPAEFVTSFRYIPPDSVLKLKDTQFVLTLTLGLSDINDPKAVEAPSPTISLDDAQMLMSNMPKDAYLYQKQLMNVRTLRSALDTYKRYAGKYPDRLEDLVITYKDVMKMNPNGSSTAYGSDSSMADYYGSTKLIRAIPKDVYTKQAFPYVHSSGGYDYALTYTIELPASSSTASPYDSYYESVDRVAKPMNGKNTATSDYLSNEKKVKY